MELSATRDQLTSKKSLFNTVCYSYGIAMILITAGIRLRLLAVPLERDEGGFAYIGQQILRGIPPYESGFSMKLPGIHLAYALIMRVFGETSSSIHFGLLLINLGSLLFLYLIARKIMSGESAALTVGTYAILSVSMKVLGIFAHATHFVILFALAGIFALLTAINSENSRMYLISGFCLGLSCTMKQNGIFFCLFAACYLGRQLLHAPKKQVVVQGGLFACGLAIPFLFIFGLYTYLGKFEEFWFWTVIYVLEYASDYGLMATLSKLFYQMKQVCSSTWLFWFLSGTGVVIFCTQKRQIELWLILPGFLATSFFAMWPGSHFYSHYFILVMPALALFAGWIMTTLPQSGYLLFNICQIRWAFLGVLLSATVIFFYQERGYLFSYSVDRVSKLRYPGNPFNESKVIADYIRNNSLPGTPIAILGSEPQIYFYTDRPSASGYLFMYCLTQHHPYVEKMQVEMIRDIEAADPKYVIFSELYTSWMFDSTSDMRVFAWAEQFLAARYEKVGLAVMSDDSETTYYWDKEARTLDPPWGSSMSVYRKLDPVTLHASGNTEI